jgi:ribosomal protein S27E
MKKQRLPDTKTRVKNTGHLCSVYCPGCGRVTEKISFNLLREASKVKVICPDCCDTTIIEYDGKTATVFHISGQTEDILRSIAKERKSNGKK